MNPSREIAPGRGTDSTQSSVPRRATAAPFAYEKAGFKPFESRTTIYGDALMMAWDASERADHE